MNGRNPKMSSRTLHKHSQEEVQVSASAGAQGCSRKWRKGYMQHYRVLACRFLCIVLDLEPLFVTHSGFVEMQNEWHNSCAYTGAS